MNKSIKIFIILFILAVVVVDLFFTYNTNLQIKTAVENSIPENILKCNKIPMFKGDLRQCNFESVNLKGVNLSKFDFEYSNFKNADLRGANFSGVNLQVASFQGADLSGADLEHSYLYRANLTRANLTDANFYHAHLPGVDLTNAITIHTNFTNVTFHVDGLEEAIKPECLNDPTCK